MTTEPSELIIFEGKEEEMRPRGSASGVEAASRKVIQL